MKKGERQGENIEGQFNEQIGQIPQSVIESRFAKAGITSNDPTDKHEVQFFHTKKPDDLATETFVFSFGRPILHREIHRYYMIPKDDGTIYDGTWTMDPGEGLLHTINLKTTNGKDIITLGFQNPYDENLSIGVKYDHRGYFGSRSEVLTDFNSSSETLIRKGGKVVPTKVKRELDISDESLMHIQITGTDLESPEKIIEKVIFPINIWDTMEWVSKFEANFIDAADDKSMPWRHWFSDLGITYTFMG